MSQESRRERRGWRVTSRGNVVLRLRLAGEDAETPYGVIFQLVHAKATGQPLIAVKLAPMYWDSMLNRAMYDFTYSRTTWIRPKEFKEFLEALGSLIPEAP